mmetsp:Transcript_120389/g.275771  ORF Transcript_120389/g.275771 Transcript_120389/m.275771 type:complete len:103 (-) Transcript_120389:98-406(-)
MLQWCSGRSPGSARAGTHDDLLACLGCCPPGFAGPRLLLNTVTGLPLVGTVLVLEKDGWSKWCGMKFRCSGDRFLFPTHKCSQWYLSCDGAVPHLVVVSCAV